MREPSAQAKSEASSILNFLASLPSGNATAKHAMVVRAIMLQTGGTMMARGHYYDVKSKALGGGVYKITLKEHRA